MAQPANAPRPLRRGHAGDGRPMQEEPEPKARHGTIGVYDAPRWWKTRRFWRLALPVLAAIASIGIWYAILA